MNFVIDGWNSLHISLPKFDTHIPGIGEVGGFDLTVPQIPRLHSGGTVPGAPGAEMLAILQAGEQVIPAGGQSAGGGVTVNVKTDADPYRIGREIVWQRSRGRV